MPLCMTTGGVVSPAPEENDHSPLSNTEACLAQGSDPPPVSPPLVRPKVAAPSGRDGANCGSAEPSPSHPLTGKYFSPGGLKSLKMGPRAGSKASGTSPPELRPKAHKPVDSRERSAGGRMCQVVGSKMLCGGKGGPARSGPLAVTIKATGPEGEEASGPRPDGGFPGTAPPAVRMAGRWSNNPRGGGAQPAAIVASFSFGCPPPLREDEDGESSALTFFFPTPVGSRR